MIWPRVFDENVSTIEDWVTTTQPFVQISQTTPLDAGDINFEVWAVINPTAKTETITVTYDAGQAYQYVGCMNFGATNTDSVAAATNILENVDNTTSSATLVFASAGTSGNAIVGIVAYVGDDTSPMDFASVDMTEIIDTNTGGGSGGNTDASFNVSYLLDAAPAGTTVTPSATDENAGIYVGIVAAAGGANILPLIHHQNMMRTN